MENQRPKLAPGAVVGAIVGWLAGYATIHMRCNAMGNEGLGGALAEVACMSMAPTAPDTILFTALGLLGGLVVQAARRSHWGEHEATQPGDRDRRGHRMDRLRTPDLVRDPDRRPDAAVRRRLFGCVPPGIVQRRGTEVQRTPRIVVQRGFRGARTGQADHGARPRSIPGGSLGLRKPRLLLRPMQVDERDLLSRDDERHAHGVVDERDRRKL